MYCIVVVVLLIVVGHVVVVNVLGIHTPLRPLNWRIRKPEENGKEMYVVVVVVVLCLGLLHTGMINNNNNRMDLIIFGQNDRLVTIDTD